MADLTPRTRSESFLNGEDLEPITRREHFYAGRENELPEGHQEPETREEWFIKKYREAGDVTVESLSITENGTYTAPSGKAYSPVSVDVPLPENAYLLKSIENVNIATFTDGTDNFVKSLEVAIEPQQDLHGYDKPWVGGAGKNKLPISSLSISGGGITAIIDRDSNNNVVSVTVNGTASGTVYVILNTFTLPSGTYTMSGCPSNGGTDSYRLYDDKHTSWADNGSGASFTLSEASQVAPTIRIANGYTVNNLKFYPMIESGSEKTTFAPYSNECPIIGWDECKVTRIGKNLWGGEKLADDIVAKVPNATKDTTNKTVTYEASDIKDVILFDKFKPNTQYSFFLSTESSYTNIAIIYTDETWEPTIPNQMCVSDASKTVARLVGIQSLGTTDLNYDECGIFEGVITAQDFEPYNGHTYTIDLDGTRYGGKLDVINGVLTVDRVNVFLKDLTFTRQARGSNVGGYYFRAEIDDNAISDTDATQLYSHGISNNPYTSKENCARAFESSAYLFVGFSDDMNITTLADFNTWVSNNQNASICYKIKTPIEIQLSPTIIKSRQGENNFFASTGEIELLQYWGEVS